jgi:hypothetical protein
LSHNARRSRRLPGVNRHWKETYVSSPRSIKA